MTDFPSLNRRGRRHRRGTSAEERIRARRTRTEAERESNAKKDKKEDGKADEIPPMPSESRRLWASASESNRTARDRSLSAFLDRP